MPRITAQEVQTIPYGPLGIIALPGTEEIARKIDSYLVKWRAEQAAAHKENIAFYGYQRDSYLINTSIARFGSGEGKAVINDTIRGYDLYIIADCFNYSVTYNMYGMDPSMFGGDETLVLNANNELVQFMFEHADGENVKLFAQQLYDLAVLANKPLSPEAMTAFVNRSNKIMMLLAK